MQTSEKAKYSKHNAVTEMPSSRLRQGQVEESDVDKQTVKKQEIKWRFEALPGALQSAQISIMLLSNPRDIGLNYIADCQQYHTELTIKSSPNITPFLQEENGDSFVQLLESHSQ